VIGTGSSSALIFFGIMMIALRALHKPVSVGGIAVGKTGTAKTFGEEAGGQVQVESELWSAEKAEGLRQDR
jgi:membrane protein implicated in regulation of membrane protease activity